PLAGGRSCGRSPAPSPGSAGKAVLGWSWLSRDLSLVSTMVKELRSETGASAVGAALFFESRSLAQRESARGSPALCQLLYPTSPWKAMAECPRRGAFDKLGKSL